MWYKQYIFHGWMYCGTNTTQTFIGQYAVCMHTHYVGHILAHNGRSIQITAIVASCQIITMLCTLS